MIRILSLCVLLAAFSVNAAEYIRATLTVTNSTTTNDAFTVNGSLRRGAGTRTSSTWVTNTSPMVTTTNIFSELGAFRPSGVTFIDRTASNVIVIEGLALTMTASNFASLVLSTNTTAYEPWALMLPPAAFSASVNASNASALVTLLASASNQIASNATLLAQFASLIGAQTLANKTLTAPILNSPSISNATEISGAVGHLTNGYWFSPVLDAPAMTNASVYEPLYVGAGASGYASVLLDGYWNIAGNNGGALFIENVDNGDVPVRFSSAGGGGTVFNLPVTVSNNVVVTGAVTSASATFKTALTATNVTIGKGTNFWHGNLITTPFTYSSLINGDNADIPIGTNRTLYLSGATTIAYIHGFLEGFEGQEIEVRTSGAVSNVFVNESGSETISAARRFRNRTGGSIVDTNQPSWLRFRYTSSRWEQKP